MAGILHELRQFNANDWAWLALVILVFFAGTAFAVFVIIRQLKQLRLSVGKGGVKLNANADEKLDYIINKLGKLEKDIVALQIMNEHLTPEERLKLYDYYKNELKGNSFIDTYISEVKKEIDRTRFS